MQGEECFSSFLGLLDMYNPDHEGEIGGKNPNKYINQCAFLAERNLFYQLLC